MKLMDDNEFLESFVDILEEVEGKEGGDTTTNISTRKLGIVNTLGVNPDDYSNNPRGLAKAVAEKNIQELKRIGVNWDELPLSMKYNALDMQFNVGSLNEKAEKYLVNLKAGNYAGAINETLDALNASDPKDGKSRPVKGIAVRRALFYNLAASDLGMPTITSVDAVNQDNAQKSAEFTYALSDGNTIVKPFKVMSLHSKSVGGITKIPPGFKKEVVVYPDNNQDNNQDNNLSDVDPTNELTPEATDTSNVTDEKTIRDTGLTIKDTEKPSGKYPFIPDFLENLFSPSEENPEPIIPQSVQEAENFDAVRKMHSEKNFNEGGAVPMKEQMSMFEDGGLMDEGNTIDPISGNDVPPGSTQEEVRDDIPAQLSEGEFVFPADVVRYIGLEKLMQMRQQAKMGLQTMDDMGQMGNSDEAIMSDTIPFELSDLDIQDETEYNNDTVEMATGGLTGPATGIAGFVPSQVPATSFVQQPQAPVTVPAPQQATTVAPKQQQTPTFTPEDMKDVSYSNLFSNSESAPQTLDIINPTTGERRTITFIPGVTPIPEGFIKASESTAPAQETSVTPTVGQAQVREETRDDARRDATERAKFEEATARKKIIAEMFGDKYLTENNAKPFSDILGKQEPGTVTTGGYIVGDNGELLNPETGEQEFFGRDGYMIPLGVKDKPKLDTSKEGGVNRRLQRAVMLQKGEERRSKISPEQRRRDKQKADEAFKSSIQSDALKEMRNVNTKPISDLPPSERAREQEKRESQRERLKASQERATQRAKSTVDPDGAYGAGIAKGGLLSKKKVKLKKMRSGGLASKK